MSGMDSQDPMPKTLEDLFNDVKEKATINKRLGSHHRRIVCQQKAEKTDSSWPSEPTQFHHPYNYGGSGGGGDVGGGGRDSGGYGGFL